MNDFTDNQLIMLALALLLKEMDYEGLDERTVNTIEKLSGDLQKRGCEDRGYYDE